MQPIYKIVARSVWEDARAAGVFHGAAIDLKDGYIHFSTPETVRETAARHFRDADDLLLVAFDPASLGPALKWEPARGGALFPHLYAPLDPALARSAVPLPRCGDGAHVFPEGVP